MTHDAEDEDILCGKSPEWWAEVVESQRKHIEWLNSGPYRYAAKRFPALDYAIKTPGTICIICGKLVGNDDFGRLTAEHFWTHASCDSRMPGLADGLGELWDLARWCAGERSWETRKWFFDVADETFVCKWCGSECNEDNRVGEVCATCYASQGLERSRRYKN